jgi:hypothetical protein
MNAKLIFAKTVIGVMSFKPITRFESVIDATPFIVAPVTKWISAMIVEKSFAPVVPLY